MDKETRVFLETMMEQINSRFDNIESKITGLEKGQVQLSDKVDKLEKGQVQLSDKVDKLEKGQVGLIEKVDKLEVGQKEIKALIEELEPKNANRHLELKESIDDLRKDLTNVEIITSSNWNEIAKLKKAR